MSEEIGPGVGDWIEYVASHKGGAVHHVGRVIASSANGRRVTRLAAKVWVRWDQILGWWPRGTKGMTLAKRRPIVDRA